MVLVKYVFECLLMYWLSLVIVPSRMLDKLRRKLCGFLWARKKMKDAIPLVIVGVSRLFI